MGGRVPDVRKFRKRVGCCEWGELEACIKNGVASGDSIRRGDWLAACRRIPGAVRRGGQAGGASLKPPFLVVPLPFFSKTVLFLAVSAGEVAERQDQGRPVQNPHDLL